MPSHFIPRQAVPDLNLPMIGDQSWRLDAQRPENFTMVVFYRGLHCPICSMYLTELNRLADEFVKRGVSVFVASSDTEERAIEAKSKWKLDNLALGYDLPLDKAREWGLYISSSRGKTSTGVEEPALFSEPGVFLVRPDGTLYYSNVQTMPFARPNFSELLKGLDFAIANDYPARGEVV